MLTRVLSFFRKPKTRIVLLHREACKLTIDQWRSDPAMTKQGASIINDPRFKAMLDVVKANGPHTLALSTVSVEDRAVWQARIEGYQLCLNTIECLGEFNKPTERLEPTYETPEQETEKPEPKK